MAALAASDVVIADLYVATNTPPPLSPPPPPAGPESIPFSPLNVSTSLVTPTLVELKAGTSFIELKSSVACAVPAPTELLPLQTNFPVEATLEAHLFHLGTGSTPTEIPWAGSAEGNTKTVIVPAA